MIVIEMLAIVVMIVNCLHIVFFLFLILLFIYMLCIVRS
jgi:hypothetical protein